MPWHVGYSHAHIPRFRDLSRTMMNQQLKQRLVGAVVLVSLAVIFIPIILEGPDDEWTPRTQGMPEPPPISYHEEAETQLPLPVEQLAPPAAIQPAEPVYHVHPPRPMCGVSAYTSAETTYGSAL